MKIKLIATAFVIFSMMSCSTDSVDTEALTADLSIPAIVDIKSFVADTKFDETLTGKYVGIFGHHSNRELHGRIYINAGLDTRYNALIELVNGDELTFNGVSTSRSNPNLFYFEGKTGSFDIDFTNILKPEVSHVSMYAEDTEAYIVLAKSKNGVNPKVLLGTYVDATDPAFFGNWDLMGGSATNTLTPITFMGQNGDVESQEINLLLISHLGTAANIAVNMPTDFGFNTSAACAPVGATLPTVAKPLLMDIYADFFGQIGNGVSAGGQTSMINGTLCTWTLNHTSDIVVLGTVQAPESYAAENCTASFSGTWSWNGRSGTTTVL